MANTEQSKSHKAHKHKSRTALGREKGLWLASSCHQLEECSPFPPSTNSSSHKPSTPLAAPSGAASQGPVAGIGVCQGYPYGPPVVAGHRSSVPPVLLGRTLVVEQGRERHLKYYLFDDKNSWDQKHVVNYRGHVCRGRARHGHQQLWDWLRLRFLKVFLQSKTI